MMAWCITFFLKINCEVLCLLDNTASCLVAELYLSKSSLTFVLEQNLWFCHTLKMEINLIIFHRLGCGALDYREQAQRIELKTGGMSVSPHIIPDDSHLDVYEQVN